MQFQAASNGSKAVSNGTKAVLNGSKAVSGSYKAAPSDPGCQISNRVIDSYWALHKTEKCPLGQYTSTTQY